MARYTLPAPQSMYRDTGAVEMTKMLRDRYMQNLAADDALAKAVLEMESMGVDDETKQALIEKYNSSLRQRTDAGNYEMLGTSIHKDAKSFMFDYYPIKKQLSKHQNFVTNLMEAVKQKRISDATAQKKIQEALYNYKGLKYNIDGTVNPDSEYVAPSFVGEVDVDNEIMTKMKDVVARKYKTSFVSMRDENFQVVKTDRTGKQEPGATAYYVTDGKNVEYIPMSIIEEVVEGVLSDDRVSSSIAQDAHLDNYFKGEIDPNTESSIASTEVDNYLTLLNSQIEKLEKKGKNRTDGEDMQLENLISKIDFITENRDKGISDLATRIGLSYTDKKEDYLDRARIKYGGELTREVTQDIKESSRFNTKYKHSLENSTPVGFRTTADQLTTPVIGGKTLDSKQKKFEEHAEAIKFIYDEYSGISTNFTGEMDDFYKTSWEGHDLIDGKTDKEGTVLIPGLKDAFKEEDLRNIGEKYQIEWTTLATIAREVRAHLRDQSIIQTQIEEATSNAFNGSTPAEIGENYNNLANNLSGSYTHSYNTNENQKYTIDINTITQALSDLGVTINTPADALRYLNDNADVRNAVIKQIAESNYTSFDKSQVDQILVDEEGQIDRTIVNEIKGEFEEEVSNTIDDILRGFNRVESKTNKTLDLEFDKPDPSMDNLVLRTFGSKEDGTHIEDIRSLFTEGINRNAAFEIGDETIAFKDIKEWEEDNLKKKDRIFADGYDNIEVDKNNIGLLHLPRTDGKSLIYIPFKNKVTGETGGYYLNADQIDSDVMNKYTSSTDFLVRRIWVEGEGGLVNNWPPPEFNPEPTDPSYPQVIFDYVNNEVHIKNSEGNFVRHSEDIGMKKIANSLNHNNQKL